MGQSWFSSLQLLCYPIYRWVSSSGSEGPISFTRCPRVQRENPSHHQWPIWRTIQYMVYYYPKLGECFLESRTRKELEKLPQKGGEHQQEICRKFLPETSVLERLNHHFFLFFPRLKKANSFFLLWHLESAGTGSKPLWNMFVPQLLQMWPGKKTWEIRMIGLLSRLSSSHFSTNPFTSDFSLLHFLKIIFWDWFSESLIFAQFSKDSLMPCWPISLSTSY